MMQFRRVGSLTPTSSCPVVSSLSQCTQQRVSLRAIPASASSSLIARLPSIASASQSISASFHSLTAVQNKSLIQTSSFLSTTSSTTLTATSSPSSSSLLSPLSTPSRHFSLENEEIPKVTFSDPSFSNTDKPLPKSAQVNPLSFSYWYSGYLYRLRCFMGMQGGENGLSEEEDKTPHYIRRIRQNAKVDYLKYKKEIQRTKVPDKEWGARWREEEKLKEEIRKAREEAEKEDNATEETNDTAVDSQKDAEATTDATTTGEDSETSSAAAAAGAAAETDGKSKPAHPRIPYHQALVPVSQVRDARSIKAKFNDFFRRLDVKHEWLEGKKAEILERMETARLQAQATRVEPDLSGLNKELATIKQEITIVDHLYKVVARMRRKKEADMKEEEKKEDEQVEEYVDPYANQGSVTEKIKDLQEAAFGETEMAYAIGQIMSSDPQFNLTDFLEDLEEFLIPVIVEAWRKGDEKALNELAEGQASAVIRSSLKAREFQGVYWDDRILDIRGVDIVKASVVEDEPVLVVSFVCQHVHCIRTDSLQNAVNIVQNAQNFKKDPNLDQAKLKQYVDISSLPKDKNAKGIIVEGGESKIETVYYMFALKRAHDHPYSDWKLVEFAAQVQTLIG